MTKENRAFDFEHAKGELVRLVIAFQNAKISINFAVENVEIEKK